MSISVMIVDDQRLMREGLRTILELEDGISVFACAENGREALDKLDQALPDVVLMDIRMPVMNGVECTKSIKEKYPQIKVIILTTFDDDEFILDAIKNGAVGYMLKDLSSERLVGVIRDVYNGNSILQPEIAARLISYITANKAAAQPANNTQGASNTSSKELLGELTDREKNVLSLVGKGLTNAEIAKKLYISEGTVKNYISSIYEKTEINDRSKLTLFAVENKLI